jgi:hypothetical protein
MVFHKNSFSKRDSARSLACELVSPQVFEILGFPKICVLIGLVRGTMLRLASVRWADSLLDPPL